MPTAPPPAAAADFPHFHPASKWQEPWKDLYLTLFDLHRQPRRIMDHPNQRVSLPLKLLGNEFQCPICLGYMKKTSIVMECLHRFCRECIQKCLRLGKKQCPSCRIHIPSRRSLRPDPKFDLLIKHICGDLNVLENQEEKEIEILNKAKHMNNSFAESRRRGMMAQAVNRKKNPQRPTRVDVATASSSAGVASTGAAGALSSEAVPESMKRPTGVPPSILNLEPSPLVEFQLRRHPQERKVERLTRELLRVNKKATVGVMKNFLSKKLSYFPPSHFQILSTVNDSSVILDDYVTLDEIRTQLYDAPLGELIALQYRIFPPPVDARHF